MYVYTNPYDINISTTFPPYKSKMFWVSCQEQDEKSPHHGVNPVNLLFQAVVVVLVLVL